MKLDASGKMEWEKSFGGSGTDIPTSIVATSDGGYMVGGRSNSKDGDISLNKGFAGVWIIKLDASGNEEWERNYGGSKGDSFESILQLKDGRYLVPGDTNSDDFDVTEGYGFSDVWVVNICNQELFIRKAISSRLLNSTHFPNEENALKMDSNP